MKRDLWLTLVTRLAYCVDREPWKAIDYLKEQVRILKEQQEEDKRILLNHRQRIRLAAKTGQLTRELLEQTTVLFTPAPYSAGTASSSPRNTTVAGTARTQADRGSRRRSSIS